jgi:beta-glucosidase
LLPALLNGEINAEDFGPDFLWGVSIAAAQNEGAHASYGRGLSIWDNFARRKGKVKKGHRPNIACDFYHRFKDDILLAKALGFSAFRFSFSWSRLIPDGT